MTADLITLLWHATLASSLAIMLVLVLRKQLRNRFGAQVAYSLWAFVPVAIAVSLIPAPVATETAAPLPMPIAPPTVASSTALAQTVASPIDIAFWLSCAWLCGVMLWTLWLAQQQRRFVAELGRLDRYDDTVWRAQNVTSCPALIGAWRPRIVLPRDFDERYTPTERTLILAHERTHIVRADAALNLGVSALRCVFWFNPLLHAAAARFRFDQEMACDASVISRFPEARRPYADAMLKTQLADRLGMEPRLPVGCHWQSSHPLKERIYMLKSSLPSPRRKRIGISLSAVFIVGVATIAWAGQPKRPADQGEVDVGDLRTDLVIRIDGETLKDWSFQSHSPGHYVHDAALPSQFTFGGPSGRGFTLQMSHAGENWKFVGTPEKMPDQTFQISGEIFHNGTSVSRPSLIAQPGQPVEVRIGETSSDGAFKGFDAKISMSSAVSSTTGAQARSVTYATIKRISYPEAAAKAGVGGAVFVLAHVGADGHVISTSLKAGPDDVPEAYPLIAAALEGVQQWTFNPATKDGKPLASDAIVPVVFNGKVQYSAGTFDGALSPIVVALPAAVAQLTDSAPSEDLAYRKFSPPKYPPAAIAAKKTGKVVLKVLVGETGEPQSAELYEAEPPEAAQTFADPSIAAVMQWTFNPGMHAGKPVSGYVLVPFTYNLTDDDNG